MSTIKIKMLSGRVVDKKSYMKGAVVDATVQAATYLINRGHAIRYEDADEMPLVTLDGKEVVDEDAFFAAIEAEENTKKRGKK